jgi:putative spermidine/putrescine transport system permease protein
VSSSSLTGKPTGLSTVALAAYAIYLLAPILLIVIGSFGQTWSNTLLPVGITGRWYVQLFNDLTFQKAFWTSLWICLATVITCVLLGVPLAYAVATTRSKWLSLAGRVLYLTPVAAPAVVLGFGYMLAFSSDTLPFLGAGWLTVAAHVMVCLPYMMQTLVSDLQLLDIERLEHAAESMGASFPRRFIDIVLPGLFQSILSGSILVAALSIGEFQLTNLIAGFLNRTYPIVLLQAFYGATGFACAATVILLLLALMASAGGALAARGVRMAGGAA